MDIKHRCVNIIEEHINVKIVVISILTLNNLVQNNKICNFERRITHAPNIIVRIFTSASNHYGKL